MARVIISAGHTTNDPGTTSNNLKEVDLTRALSKKLIPKLRANGIITLSVPPNLDLVKRVEWINNTGYSEDLNDIAIEIHINDGGKSGYEFWYKGNGNNKSQTLANLLMNKVTSSTKLPNQGVRSELTHEFGSLAFISNTKTISVLLECLYIDNQEDAKKLQNDSELDKITQALADGVTEFLTANQPAQNGLSFNNNSKMPAPTPQIDFPKNPTFQQPVIQPVQPPIPQKTMSRDERKDMITNTYKKILGKEPNQNDLNYFLNIGIAEDKLIERMINSQDHLDMVNGYQEMKTIKTTLDNQAIQLTRLTAENQDNKTMIENLTKLLHQKNYYISRMKTELLKRQSVKPTATQKKPAQKKYKGKFIDRFFHFFSSILG